MYSNRFGQRNLEKDVERALTSLVAAPSFSSLEYVYRLSVAASATDTTVTLNRAIPGPTTNDFYLVIDPFTTECEVRKVTGVSSATYTVAALDYAHAVDDIVLWISDPIINVKWMGAKGDNSTVETTSIRRACYAAGAFGGTVYFPNGIYLTDSIFLSNDDDSDYPNLGRIALVGEQTAFINSVTDTIGSQLVHIDSSAQPLIEIDGTSNIARAVRIENLLLRSGDSSTSLIKTWRCSEHTILRNLYLKVENSACHGVVLESSWNVTVDHVTVRGDAAGAGTWTGTGFRILSPSSGVTVNQLMLLNCASNYMGTGFQIGERTDTGTSNKGPILMLGGQASNCDQQGIFIGNGVRNVGLYGVHVESCYDQGILIDNFARGVSILDCDFNGNGEGSSVYEIQIGGGAAEATTQVYIRQCNFKASALGIDIRINAAEQQFIDIDHITMTPATPSSGTGILVESTTSYNSVVFLGPNINFTSDFATNISDANYNINRWAFDNHVKVFSGAETTPDVSNPIALKHIRFNNSGSTTVTNFTNGHRGQMLVISFANANTTIQDNANIELNGSDYTPSDSGRTLVLVNVNDVWTKVASTNQDIGFENDVSIGGDVSAGGGLYSGSSSGNPGTGEVVATSHILTDGGVYVGNKAGSVTNDNLIADGDISAGGGIYSGSAAGNPATGEVTATSHIRTDGGVYVGNKAGSVSNDDLIVDGDIYTVGWTDYSSTSTITGWSSLTTQEIWYRKVGDMVFVQFNLEGTSDNQAASFTLPFNQQSDTSVAIPIRARDSGTYDAGHLSLAAGGALVTLRYGWAVSATSWTATGTKSAIGSFWYQTA